MTITAKIIQDSVSTTGVCITTFELEYPRFIHSEFMTHRQFSRNAASSRAIPVEAMHREVINNMASPIHWGVNKPGMQATETLTGLELQGAMAIWQSAGEDSVRWSRAVGIYNLHKQIANRITEPFQHMKTVITATEFKNWYWLRNHRDAQPEIRELAAAMLEAHDESTPMMLLPGQWHVPYVKRTKEDSMVTYWDNEGCVLDATTARIISASCCAQVSYRKSDDSLEKAKMVFDRLINSVPCHASPVEHQATPIRDGHSVREQWDTGVTHMDRDGQPWSGNFRGWIQHRQLIPNHSK